MENGEIEILHVDEDGKICIKCLSCQIDKIVNAPKGKNCISVRCKKCGGKTFFKINRRKGIRKEYREKMYVNGTQVLISNLSLGGLAFNSEKLNISVGDELAVELPLIMVRKDIFEQPVKIEVVSRRGARYGAKFLNLRNESKAKKRIGSWLMVA